MCPANSLYVALSFRDLSIPQVENPVIEVSADHVQLDSRVLSRINVRVTARSLYPDSNKYITRGGNAYLPFAEVPDFFRSLFSGGSATRITTERKIHEFYQI